MNESRDKGECGEMIHLIRNTKVGREMMSLYRNPRFCKQNKTTSIYNDSDSIFTSPGECITCQLIHVISNLIHSGLEWRKWILYAILDLK